MSQWATWVSAGFGAGYSPIAPGTVGTLVGALLIYGFHILGFNLGWHLVLAIISYTGIAYVAIKNLPSSWVHDDQRIVSDEVVGLWLTMLFVPFSIVNLAFGVVLFRVFDIFKPLGIRRLDRWRHDWGVLVDDLLAGVYANITLQLILLLL